MPPMPPGLPPVAEASVCHRPGLPPVVTVAPLLDEEQEAWEAGRDGVRDGVRGAAASASPAAVTPSVTGALA